MFFLFIDYFNLTFFWYFINFIFIYIYSFNRFASGLRDLDGLLTEILDEIGANIVCLEDDIDFSTEFGKGARRGLSAATPLINADPIYGFFK